MICEDREENIARLEWQEAKAAIRRQKAEMLFYGANVDRRARLSLLKLRARMWKKMVPMNAVFKELKETDAFLEFWGPHYECPACHANVCNAITPIIIKSCYCRWCGQRLSWRQITGKQN